MEERWLLMLDKLSEIAKDPEIDEPYRSYFGQVASFLVQIIEQIEEPNDTKEENEKLYKEIMPVYYQMSYLNPGFACQKFGMNLGRLLSFVYAQIYSLIESAFENRKEEILFHIE